MTSLRALGTALTVARGQHVHVSRHAGKGEFVPQHRRHLRLVLANGALWSIGNGLTSGAVIYYLAYELGASGSDVAWILAAPALAGVLRLWAPGLIHLFGSARRTCLWAWLLAYVLIWGVPLLASPVVASRLSRSGGVGGIALLVIVLCAHQLLEYVGVVGFWAWMAELVPRRIRGRYFASRNRWQLATLIPALLASGWVIDLWKARLVVTGRLSLGWGYALVTAVGALCLLLSLIPLARIRDAHFRPRISEPKESRQTWQALWRDAFAPFADRRFRPLLVFGCFVGLANGLTQAAQSYANKAYGLALTVTLAMRIAMLLGQYGVSGPIGRWSDRLGNRPVLVVCQGLVALGPLFYLLASPQHPRWIWGAWLVWAAFAGLNICLPNLMLKLAPRESAAGVTSAGLIATYFATGGLVYALSTVVGGYVLVALQAHGAIRVLGTSLQPEGTLFLLGWILRSLGVLLALRIMEPGAARLRDLLPRKLTTRRSAPGRDSAKDP